MLTPGIQLPAEVVFSFRMLMVKHNLTPADIMRLLVELDKDRSTK
jgi:hypothetical protein